MKDPYEELQEQYEEAKRLLLTELYKIANSWLVWAVLLTSLLTVLIMEN